MYTFERKDKRFHFLAMPRTASTACRDALRKIGAVDVGGHHCIKQYREVVRPGDVVVTTIRNHWDWFSSFWSLNSCPDKFHQFVRRTVRNSEWVKRNPDCTVCQLYWQFVPLANYVIRYEDGIEDQLNKALASMELPTVKLEQVGKKKDRHYHEYYTPATVDFVYRHFKDEIDAMGYEY
jgi:mitochondrial fission protein ELM1